MDKPPELIKDSRDAEVYPAPLPQPTLNEKNQLDEVLEAPIKSDEMFLIINVDPFEGKFP
jgi:hypothetical protein